MSRTYRKVPHWITKKGLREDYRKGVMYGNTARRGNCDTSDKFVKVSMALYRGERSHRWNGMGNDVLPNGNIRFHGFDSVPRDKRTRRITNRKRRAMDKKEVQRAIDQMIEDAYEDMYEDMYEMEAMFGDYEDTFFYDDEYDPFEDDWERDQLELEAQDYYNFWDYDY